VTITQYCMLKGGFTREELGMPAKDADAPPDRTVHAQLLEDENGDTYVSLWGRL
jgi:hypothetical protein